MNKRDVFLPSISALIVFGFIWFLSCSHSASRRQPSQEELSSENTPLPAEDGALKENEKFESKVNEALKQEAVPASPETQTVAEVPKDVQPEVSQETVSTPASVPAPSRWKSQVPVISQSPKSYGRFKLNRFYFVRKGDTPEVFSEKVYGDSSFAKQLNKWNPGKWIPGKLVYYQSSKNASDSRVQSYYQEAGLSTYEYHLKKGESLSRVAKKELGHYRSWRELAVINGIKDVDQVGVGTILAIYSFSPIEPLAQVPAEKPMPVAKAPNPAAPPAPASVSAPIPSPASVKTPAPAPAPAPALAPAPVAKAPRPVPPPGMQPRNPSSPMRESWTQKFMTFLENFWEETTDFIETTAKKFSAKSGSKKRKP